MEETLAELLKRIREKKGLSQRKVEKIGGLKGGYVCQLESGKTKGITLRTARRLAKGLGVRPEIFLSSKDAEGLYLSEHLFEGALKEIQERYGFPTAPLTESDTHFDDRDDGGERGEKGR